jgi:hypothetical protein
VVDKVALVQVFYEYFGFPCQFHSTNFSTITLTYHLGLVQYASSGRSTQSPTAQIKKKDSAFIMRASLPLIAGRRGRTPGRGT